MKNNPHFYSPQPARRQCGLSLVEIMVALVISLFLTAGVIQLFIGSKQTYRFHDALSRLQENGRLALDTMAADIRMAGFGYPNNDAIQDNAGVITSRWIDGNATTTPLALCPNANPAVSNVCSFRRYSVQARTAGGTVPTCVNARTSLFQQRDGAAANELVEGIEAMQLLYGEDITGDSVADVYRIAGNVVNWNSVVSVRIDLLLVSLADNIVTQPQTIFFPSYTNNVFPVNDRCLRQSFSTTVVVRNRML